MKTSLTLMGAVLFTFNMNALAGPEEHKQYQSCYQLETTKQTFPSPHVPQEICLESVIVDPSTLDIFADSYFQPKLFQGLKVASLSKSGENSYNVVASNILHQERQPRCGPSEKIQLILRGKSDSKGNIPANELQVSIEIETSKNVCQSEFQKTILNFRLR